MDKTFGAFLIIVLIIFGGGCLSQDGAVEVNKTITSTQPPREIFILKETKESTDNLSKSQITQPDSEFIALLNDEYKTCIICHGDIRSFHTASIIYLIDKEKGLNPRLCIVCHGPKIHSIHWDLLQSDYIICDTCHDIGGKFIKPQAEEGQLLVCEVCHSRGNYIKIHIEGKILEGAPIDEKWIREGTRHQCDTCHVGDFSVLHFEPLSNWREGINELIQESALNPPSPLNISYS
jgi:hypothetical protein